MRSETTEIKPIIAPIGISLGLYYSIELTPNHMGSTKLVYKISITSIVYPDIEIWKNSGLMFGFLKR